LDLQHCA